MKYENHRALSGQLIKYVLIAPQNFKKLKNNRKFYLNGIFHFFLHFCTDLVLRSALPPHQILTHLLFDWPHPLWPKLLEMCLQFNFKGTKQPPWNWLLLLQRARGLAKAPHCLSEWWWSRHGSGPEPAAQSCSGPCQTGSSGLQTLWKTSQNHPTNSVLSNIPSKICILYFYLG